MPKPIPRSHGTPYQAPQGDTTLNRPRKNAEPGPSIGTGPKAPDRRSPEDKAPIANALLGRAQSENPSTAGGSGSFTNATPHAPTAATSSEPPEETPSPGPLAGRGGISATPDRPTRPIGKKNRN